MSVTSKFRIYGEIIGSGSDKQVSCLATISDTPTKYGGTYTQTFTTTAPVDIIGVTSGELITLYVRAISSGLYINPVASTPMITQCCFIPQGQFNMFTFQTTVSCVPFAEAQTSTAVAEIMFAAVS
jgi:hypothetical protein